MLRYVIALVFIVLVVLASVVYYYYSQHSVNQVIFLINESVESRTTAQSGGAWYDDVAVRVNYTVIDDPETLSIAREFIKASLPLPARLDKKKVTDWLNADIAVLKVIVELVNNGDKPIYYITNAFCEVCFNATVRDHRFEPVTWKVEDPITLLKITTEEGDIFPLIISCTLDLKYKKVAPKSSIANEFYYIVTKPFRGIIRALATICPEPFSNECRTIESYVPVYVANASSIDVPGLVGRINDFTLNLYGVFLEKYWSRNVVVSPFNVYVALTLLYEGANGSTREELGSVMGLTNVSVHEAYQKLLNTLPISESNDSVLIMANAVWLRQGFPFRNEYIEFVSRYYDAEVRYFNSVGQLVSEVNSWVNAKTRGLIKELLDRGDVREDAVAVIASVIYFKARWAEEFKPTSPIDFWTEEDYVKAPAMELTSDKLKVVHGSDYIAVKIPYSNTNISMVIIVPEKYVSIRSTYKNMVMEALSKLRNCSKKTVRLIMPKFNITLRTDLVEILENMGVKEVFTPGKADLTRMANVGIGDVWVDKVVHQAVIKVDEKGTEAAAATAVVVSEAFPMVDEEVVVNKPFIFMLWDENSSAILFIGHVVNPTET